MSIPSISTDNTCTGSISGLSFISIGVETVSSKYPSTISILLLISIMAESIFTLWEKAIMIMEAFSIEILCISSRPLVVARTLSSGCVTVVSTRSGDAPGAVVITIT